ncbi:membrane or secreted protein [Pedobacter metabolipauper]|nr:membrane or secreted protein [Pedobacter metabolipauper]
MKTIKLLMLTMLTFGIMVSNLKAQVAITGAWRFSEGSATHQLLFQDGFFFHSVYEGDKFITTQGGKYEVNNQTIKASILFNSSDSAKVGTTMDVPVSVSATQLVIEIPEGRIAFNRVDDSKAAIAGVWHITGRMGADGKVEAIHQAGTRQTYKLLTGTKFQWVAIDPAKKQFSGTGGGSYTFKDGKYIENIEFFSRDNTRVGASLSFDGKLENGDWHHSGLSSKGAKIYEVWSKVK